MKLNRLAKRASRFLSPANRQALIELFRAKLRSVDHDSFQGVLWSLLNPALTVAVLYAAFKTNLGHQIANYPLYLIVGVVTVNFFLTSTWHMIKMLDGHRNLLLSYVVLPETVAAASFMIAAYKFLIELAICLLISAYLRGLSFSTVALLPPVTLLYLVFVFSISFILSLLYLWAGDVEHVWSALSRGLYFATPVFYSLDQLPSWAFMPVEYLNPLTAFTDAFRSALMGSAVSPSLFFRCLAISAVSLLVTFAFFLAVEDAAMERL